MSSRKANELPEETEPMPRLFYAIVEGVIVDRDYDAETLVARIKGSGFEGHVLVVPEPERR